MSESRRNLSEIAQQLMRGDDPVARELRRKFGDNAGKTGTMRARVGECTDAAMDFKVLAPQDESIVRKGRPVMKVKNGQIDLAEVTMDAWLEILTPAKPLLSPAFDAVGRIEIPGDRILPYVGTGWLIEENVVVTNRHVALHFIDRRGERLVFSRRGGIAVEARVDFLEEQDRQEERNVPIVEAIWMAPDGGPDVAFLRLAEQHSGNRRVPLAVGETVQPQEEVAAIGYPLRQRDFPDQRRMLEVFGDVFEKKRFAPGFVTSIGSGVLLHDCSTLRGNSGSPIISLKTGRAVALHYQGEFDVTNRAVPAVRVKELLEKARRPQRATEETASDPQESSMSNEYTFTIPLTVTVKLGTAVQVSRVEVQPVEDGSLRIEARGTELEALAAARELLGKWPGVVAVRLDWRYRDGALTEEKAVIVKVRAKHEKTAAPAGPAIPHSIRGFPVDVEQALPHEIEAELSDFIEEATRGPGRYEPPAGFSLNEIPDTENVTITCHASPDAGWPKLAEFLDRTEKSLTIGMYELTAPHVVNRILSVMQAPRTLDLAIQGGSDIGGEGSKGDDWDEEDRVVPELRKSLRNRFTYQWVPIGSRNGLVPMSYHIKVAVRDGRETWLSSGSWQSSNQPNVSPAETGEQGSGPLEDFNREWHLIVEHESLAQTLEKYVKWDMEQSRDLRATVAESAYYVAVEELAAAEEAPAAVHYFEPKVITRGMRIQPLLTPDGYWQKVVELIDSAEDSLCFQNQSLSILLDKEGLPREQEPHFQRLLNSLHKAQDRVEDFRVIVRSDFFGADEIRALKKWGFDLSRVKFQPRCHNKGIVVDRRAVLVGSHNWTNMGTAWNRDLSLIVHDDEVAQYFQAIFDFDWANLATHRGRRTDPALYRARAGASVPRGFVRWEE